MKSLSVCGNSEASHETSSFLLLVCGVAMAQSAGMFTATGNMTAPRAAHSATLLPNGKVLIVGGRNLGLGRDEDVWASAELYDSNTNTFTVTGNMQMTLKVLITTEKGPAAESLMVFAR